MAELRYVDWDGLVYYDGKVKEFIRDKAEDYLKMGGVLPIKDLPDPSWQNLNYIYKITDKFTSNDRFEKPGYVYPAGTWVQCVNSEEDERWLYIIFNEETIGGTADIDLSDYYTKSEVDKKIKDAIDAADTSDVDLSDYYTKDEVDSLIPDDFATQSDIDVIDEAIAEVQTTIDYLSENKADKTQLKGLATEEFVTRKIAEAELADQDVDLSAYYTKSETEAKIKEAVDAIEIPDVSDFATREELQTVESKIPSIEGLATKTELEEAINSIEHPTVDLTGYATEKFVLDKVAEINVPTKVSELENDTGFITADNLPDTSTFVTNETFETVQEQVTNIQNTYVTESYVANTYVTQDVANNTYVTTEKVTEVVETQVNEVVTKEIETKVTEVIQEKVNNGEISVNTDAIDYDTW